MYRERSAKNNDLYILLGIAGTLVVIGLLFIYSASSVYALETFGSAAYFVKKQASGLLIALAAFFIMRFMPLSLIRFLTPLFFVVSLVLTALTLLPRFAPTIHGSARWLSIAGFKFQPSELLKIWFIMLIASILAKKEHSLKTMSLKTFLTLMGIIIGTALLLLKQPDFGMAVTLVITSMALLFIMKVNTKYLFLTFCALIPAGLILIAIKPYRLQRIMTFLNPWRDPQGSGFQIIQSLIAIGSGGWWGLGIGHSKQKFFYLPMQHTDFIFSIIVEETGFVGALIIILLYLAFLYIGLRIAWRQQDSFGTIFTLGFVILISLQAIIHLGVTTSLLPPKGVGLPLISYGKSSLISIFAMLGLIANAAHNRS
jgi:cell division protein FtsW